MEETEKQYVPEDICPSCYRPKSAHAVDCDYEKKVADYQKAEGITPEFEAGVRSGKITFEGQMQEINNFLEGLKEPLPNLSIENAKERFTNILSKFEESRKKALSHSAVDVQKARSIDSHIDSILNQVNKTYKSIVTQLKILADLPASDPEINVYLDDLDSEVENFKTLVSDFEDRLEKFTP